MASTPIYNWPTPDNTGLVKNGALDMRTLGNAIDTTMATMVPKTIVDAKGDLIAATAADTTARLAVGNNGETLVADSSTSTGLRYQEPKAGNPVLNSAMQIAQRGTSFSIAANTMVDTLDRWRTYIPNTGCTFSQQLTGDTTNLPNIQYCLRVARNSGQTVTGLMQLAQNFETVNSIPFVGKTVTMSFYARRGANFSSSSNLLNVYLYSGTGTDQNLLQNYTGAATPINSTATLTTTWQRFSFTGTISASATEIAPYFTYTPSGTAGAADYYEITGVQLEVGSVATPFKTYAATIQGELAACQRYYYRFGGSSAYQRFAAGLFQNSTQAWINVQNPVPMRAAPTSVDFSNLAVYDGNSIIAMTGISAVEYANNIAAILVSVASGGTQYRPVQIFANNTFSAFLGFSAEL